MTNATSACASVRASVRAFFRAFFRASLDRLAHARAAAVTGRSSSRPILPLLACACAASTSICSSVAAHGAEELIPKVAVIPSLVSETIIDLDAVEIPTIHAASIEDAVRAEGWIHARERFLQMDLARREAAGELWQLVPAAKPRDLDTLPLQLRDAARRALAALPASQRALLDRYAEGVNAFLDRETPFEYRMLKVKPTAWRAEDSLLIQLGMARYLDGSPGADRARTALLRAFPAETAAFLASSSGPLDRSIDGSPLPEPPAIPDATRLDFPASRARATSAGDAPLAPAPREISPGSNAFAVAGSRTKDGRAIVANDMHLMLTAPGIWYRVRLLWKTDGSEEMLEGLSLPGVPLVVQGTNGHVAWAFTNLTADLADLIVVEPDPADPTRYLTAEGSEPFSTRNVRVGAGGAAEDVVLRSTRYGPIVETRTDGTMLALRWAHLVEGGLDCGLFALASARSLDEALDTARRWNGPPQNFLVADRTGRIGWTVAGALPDRAARTPGIVAWRDAPEWRGVLDPARKPVIVDPAEGVLTSANQLSLAPDGAFTAITGADEAHGDRAHRLAEILRARRDWNEPELHRVQLDLRSPRLIRWRDALLATIAPDAGSVTDAATLRAIEVLRAWNGEVTADAAAPVILDAARSCMRRAFGAALAADAASRGIDVGAMELASAIDDEAMLRVLAARPAHLLPRGDDWPAFAGEVLREASRAAESPAQGDAKGDAQSSFRTRGDVNRAAIRHPAADALGAAARIAEMPRTPLPGHPTTVRVQTPSFGASQRSVVSPGREEDAILVTPAGQSGLPTSPHFRSLHRSWQEGLPYPLRPSEATARVRLVASADAAKDAAKDVPRDASKDAAGSREKSASETGSKSASGVDDGAISPSTR